MEDFVETVASDCSRLANPVNKVPFLGGVAFKGMEKVGDGLKELGDSIKSAANTTSDSFGHSAQYVSDSFDKGMTKVMIGIIVGLAIIAGVFYCCKPSAASNQPVRRKAVESTRHSSMPPNGP